MRATWWTVVGIVVLSAVPSAIARSSWELRLIKMIKSVEIDVEKLDGLTADRKAKIDVRILALDKRVAVLEKARKIKVVNVKLGLPGTLSDMSTRSAAIVRISGRVRRIKKFDKPPPVTVNKKGPAPKATPKIKPKPKKDEPLEWPDEIEIKATASLDYTHIGIWLYGSTRRSRYVNNEYLHTGYVGDLHLSARLGKLVRQVKEVDFVIIVTGRTGPFKMTHPVKYEITWRASHHHMGNGAVRTWNHYDQWNQNVFGGWIRGPRHKNVKPRVKAYLTHVITEKGRVLEFSIPKKYR